MTRVTRSNLAVMCNLISTHKRTHTHTHGHLTGPFARLIGAYALSRGGNQALGAGRSPRGLERGQGRGWGREREQVQKQEDELKTETGTRVETEARAVAKTRTGTGAGTGTGSEMGKGKRMHREWKEIKTPRIRYSRKKKIEDQTLPFRTRRHLCR